MMDTKGIKMYFAQGRVSMFQPRDRASAYNQARLTFDEWYARQNPAGWTIDQLLNEAWEKALPVKSGTRVRKGTRYIVKTQEGWYTMGVFAANLYFDDSYAATHRLCPPLPTVIPDDCMAVRATGKCAPGLGRTIWQRSNDGTEWFAIDQADGSLWADSFSHLIDPKPVPEEER